MPGIQLDGLSMELTPMTPNVAMKCNDHDEMAIPQVSRQDSRENGRYCHPVSVQSGPLQHGQAVLDNFGIPSCT